MRTINKLRAVIVWFFINSGILIVYDIFARVSANNDNKNDNCEN